MPKDCLASGAVAVTVGRELGAIFRPRVEAGQTLRVSASCEPGPSKTRQFCTLSVSSDGGDSESSAGFTFLGNPQTGELDIGTIECFHTP